LGLSLLQAAGGTPWLLCTYVVATCVITIVSVLALPEPSREL
jgi:hypothetical protein